MIAIDDGQFAKHYFNIENDICSTVYGFKVSNQLVKTKKSMYRKLVDFKLSQANICSNVHLIFHSL